MFDWLGIVYYASVSRANFKGNPKRTSALVSPFSACYFSVYDFIRNSHPISGKRRPCFCSSRRFHEWISQWCKNGSRSHKKRSAAERDSLLLCSLLQFIRSHVSGGLRGFKTGNAHHLSGVHSSPVAFLSVSLRKNIRSKSFPYIFR